MGRRAIEGWYSGTSIDAEDTLHFSAQAGIRPMNESYPLERADEAYYHMMSGKAPVPGRFDDVTAPGPLEFAEESAVR